MVSYLKNNKEKKNPGRILKVSRSRNKIVEPQILPKNERTNLFFYHVLLFRIEKQIRLVVFWENLRLYILFRDLLTFRFAS